MTAILDGTGHPRNFGYVGCSRCGTCIPLTKAEFGPSAADVGCEDHAWCDRMTGKAPSEAVVAKTGLDSNGDAQP